MSTVNSNIQIGKKNAAFFAANPALVLLDGQLIYNEDTGDLFIGDGVTPLSGLTPINGGSGFTPSGTNLDYIAGDGSYIIFPTDNAAFTNGAGYLSSGDINVTVQPYDGDTTILGNAVVGDSVVVTDSTGLLDSVTLSGGESIRRNAGNTAFEAYTPVSTSTGAISGFIEYPSNKDYMIVVKAPYGGTITETTTISTSGTCTATFKINTTPLGGTANSVSSVEQSQLHSSSNVFSSGDDIVITISSNSACLNMSFTIAYTYSL